MHPDDDTAHNIRSEMQRDAAAGDAREEEEKRQRRLSMGMCPMCGEQYANPALPNQWCTECTKSTDSVCSSNGCLGSKVGYYYERPFCEAHLVEILQSQYQEYLELGSKLNNLEQEFHDKCNDKEVDPENVLSRDPSNTNNIEELVNLKTQIDSIRVNAESIKQRIKKTSDSVNKIYPEEYDTGL